MDVDAVIEELEGLIRRFGVEIRYEPIHIDEETINAVGGLCLLRGERLLIINSNAAKSEKIRAFLGALKHFDIDQIYISPAIRGLLETTATHRCTIAPNLLK